MARKTRKYVTIEDVAITAGVSVSSVSRVISNHPDVSESMHQRVSAAIKQLDYTPDYAAQSLRSGSTRTIALLARDIANPVFAEIAKGAETEARKAGYTIAILDSNEDPQIEADNVLTMRRRKVDAYLVSFVDDHHQETIERLRLSDAALVMLDRVAPKSLSASEVLTDHYSGVRAAVEHLVSIKKSDNVAFIGGHKNSRPTYERIRALKDGLEAANVEFNEELVRNEGWKETYCKEMALDLLKTSTDISAIICGGTQSTVGVIEALSHFPKKKCPPVVSCDMISLLFSTPYPIGVIKRNSNTIGKIAVRLAFDAIQGLPPKTTTVPTFYCKREST